MQNGVPFECVKSYLAYYTLNSVASDINSNVEGFASIFYAVATNNDAIVRMWVSYGADVSAVHIDSGVPLLAFSIVHSETIKGDTIQMVNTLLSLGASPLTIPLNLYMPFLADPGESNFKGAEFESAEVPSQIAWCTKEATKRLVQTLNLFQRYNLATALKTKQPSFRHRQVSKLKKAEPILGIPYFLIGQTIASDRLLKKLLAYLMIPSKKPLVLVFAGPSGHGKTELARRLGQLLSLGLEVVDCTIFNREMELFGPRHPYTRADEGSPLNNFLAQNSEQRCIVFLDEFEKTTKEIHQALLLPFDNGEYQDRRSLATVNCSKTIWILATNALDETITDFCQKNEEVFSQIEEMRKNLAKEFSKQLKNAFLSLFGAPITGRISDFIPFLPFSSGEQAVVAYKFMNELCKQVKNPVTLLPGPDNQLLGDIRLSIRKDGTVCTTLAEAYYHKDLGARSLHAAVEHEVKGKLLEAYLAEEEEIKEGDSLNDYVVDFKGGDITVWRVPKQKMIRWW